MIHGFAFRDLASGIAFQGAHLNDTVDNGVARWFEGRVFGCKKKNLGIFLGENLMIIFFGNWKLEMMDGNMDLFKKQKTKKKHTHTYIYIYVPGPSKGCQMDAKGCH